MDRLVVLGTGNAMVTKYYNTCFALCRGEDIVLVDAGGGNGILRQFRQANLAFEQVRELIVTHEHCDHLLGVVWVVRRIATLMTTGAYTGKFHIHCHARLIETIQTICKLTLQKKFTNLFNEKILFCEMADGTQRELLGCTFTFFDIHSTKAEQYGFTLRLPNNRMLTCLGDEPCSPLCEKHATNCDWLLSEAFCLYSQRETFQPYEKHHSTVKDACELAERLGVKQLILWHTEDKNYENRKALYTAEGRQFYTGNLLVPEDGEVIRLDA